MEPKDMLDYILLRSKQYSIIDTHCFNSIKEGIVKPSKEIVVTTWIFTILIIPVGLLHFIAMIPWRLIGDIKNCFRDFIRGMNK